MTGEIVLWWAAEIERVEAGRQQVPPDEGAFAGLRRLIKTLRLPKHEGYIIDVLCLGRGRAKVADLVSECDWATPYRKTWYAAKDRLNAKLRPHGWVIEAKGKWAEARQIRLKKSTKE